MSDPVRARRETPERRRMREVQEAIGRFHQRLASGEEPSRAVYDAAFRETIASIEAPATEASP